MYNPGLEPKLGNVGGSGVEGWRGIKWGKWDNCNSIINKYIKKIGKQKQKQKVYVNKILLR